MTTRAFTSVRTRVSVMPLFMALVLSLLAPLAAHPTPASATDAGLDGLSIAKTATADLVHAGDEASFTITVRNHGPSDASDVTLHDTLPAGPAWDYDILEGDADCAMASSIVDGGAEQRSIDCDLGALAPSDSEAFIVRVFADSDRDDCGLLESTATATASSHQPAFAAAGITVRCPSVSLVKDNGAGEPVLPGSEVAFALTLSVGDGPAQDVTVIDTLPDDLVGPSEISAGGTYDPVEHTITWELGDLVDGEYSLPYRATVGESADLGEFLVNVAVVTSANSQCPQVEALDPACIADSTVVVGGPTLVLDIGTHTEIITITGGPGAQVADPATVDWTLSYTLVNGPVTNAVISDPLPDGLVYVAGSASDGGLYDAATNTLTWIYPVLRSSGSVTYRTSVDTATISRVGPTVNVAVISSDQTAEDRGEASVAVVVDPPPLGGNPIPSSGPVLPDTAMGLGANRGPVTIPVELLVAYLLGSLGAVAKAGTLARSIRR